MGAIPIFDVKEKKMGVGNYCADNGITVQVSHEQIYGEYTIDGGYELIEDEFDYQIYFNEFIGNLNSLIPKSYDLVDEYDHYESARIIAENGFYTVQVKDWEGYVAVSLVLKENNDFHSGVHPLGEYHLETRANTLCDELASCYELRVSTSAWTSGDYEVSKVA